MASSLDTPLPESALLEAVLATAPVGIGFLDRDLRFVRVNDALAAGHGLPAGEHLGRRVEEVWTGAPPELVAALEGLLETGEPLTNVEVSCEHEGRQRHLLGSYYPVVAADGTISGVGVVVVEITERRRAEDALRSSERRLSELLESVQLIGVSLDMEGRITYSNPYLSALTGWSPEELAGRDWYSVFTPPELMDLRRVFLESLAAGEVAGKSESPILTRSGERRTIAWSNTLLRDPGGRIVGATSIGADVTERRRAVAALRALAEEQGALRRIAVLVAHEPSPEEVFLAVAEEAGRVLGAESAAVIRYDDAGTATVVGRWDGSGIGGFPAGAVLPIEEPRGVLARVRATGLPARVDDYSDLEGEVAAALKAIGFCSIVGAPVTAAGRLWGLLAVGTARPEPLAPDTEQRLTDFGELIGLAVASADARQEVARSRARIVAAADGARRRLERNLHDGAQQHLVGLALTLRLAQDRLEDDPAASAVLLERARDELERALGELRELARGIHPAILSERGLRPAVEAIAARSPFPVKVSVDLAERPPEAVEVAAYYVASEALANAAKHADATLGSIAVSAGGGRLVLEIMDDGRGGAELGAGTGLAGLADRVEALGGTLTLRSPSGQGTLLRAELPVP